MIRHAVLLVGGRGTRLWPLTQSTPKALIPLAGRPFIEWQLSNLRDAGIEEAWLTVGTDQLEVWERYVGSWRAHPALHLAVEEEPLDTAGGVHAILGQLDDRFLVLNGDVIFDVALTPFIASAPPGGVMLGLARVPDPSAYGVVVTDADGRVERFVEKPPPGTAPADTVSAGVYLVERRALERFDSGALSFERLVFPDLAADKELWGRVVAGRWLDIGTAALYLEAHDQIMTGRVGQAPPGAPHSAAPTAEVRGDMRGSWSWVGPDAIIEEGAEVWDSVVLDGAIIRSGATITRSVIGWGSEVGAGSKVGREVLVGRGARIGEGCELSDAHRVADGTVLGPRAITKRPPS